VEQALRLHEGQSGFKKDRSCIDNIYVLSEIIRGRAQQRQHTYVFYLDVRKAFDSVWHDGMWCKLWEKGVRGRLWRTIRSMYTKMRSRVRVNGTISEDFPIERGTAQGCTFSPLLFNIFVDGLLEAVEDAGFGLPLAGGRMGALMFADDFAGVEDSAARLQQLVDTAASYLQLWGLGANVAKSAVVVYGPGRSSAPRPAGGWTWAGTQLPEMDTYRYLGVQLHGNAQLDSPCQQGHHQGEGSPGSVHEVSRSAAPEQGGAASSVQAVCAPGAGVCIGDLDGD